MRPSSITGARPAALLLAMLATTLHYSAAAQEAKPETAGAEPGAAPATPAPAAPDAATPKGTTPDTAPGTAAAAGTEAGAPEEAAAAAAPPVEPAEPTAPPAAVAGTETAAPTPPPAAAAAAPLDAVSAEEESWFFRPPLRATVGKGNRELSLTFYGFLQGDFIYDTTRSYAEAMGDSLVARTDTYDGTVGRAQFSSRNTRLGFELVSPEVGGVRPTAVLEGDFFGNQPAEPPELSERAYYESPTFRLRQAYMRLDNELVVVLVGQTYDVFGWQNRFFPCTAEFLGIPHQVYSRSTQVRLSHAFGASGPVGLEVAASAVRPAQRDSGVPDGNAGLLFTVNEFQGLATPGNGATRPVPLSLGVSGTVRHFKVDAFTPPPTQTANDVLGWGISVDALVPVIPVKDAAHRSNALTLTGSFVTGTGIGDLMTATGGATFPTLPNPALANPPPEYEGNIDAGIVSFDVLGVLNTIDWQGFKVGLEYHLPPSGRVFIAVNYSQAHSANLRELFPQGGAEIELLTHVADRSLYADANLFFDATPAVRLGISGAYTTVEYLDGDQPENVRGRFQAMYFF